MKILRWLWYLLEKMGENAIYLVIDKRYVDQIRKEEISKGKEGK